jgi:CheY-like chemotaxis protein
MGPGARRDDENATDSPDATGNAAAREPVLGVAGFQEALRAIGGDVDRLVATGHGHDTSRTVRVEYGPAADSLVVDVDGEIRRLEAHELQELVKQARAARGTAAGSGTYSDLLRSAGLALDELGAVEVTIALQPASLVVRYRGASSAEAGELAYAGEELEALRLSAAQRRTGNPLRRVLILRQEFGTASHIRALLVAEFAVEDLAARYASAAADAPELPHLVILHLGSAAPRREGLGTVQTFRSAARTAGIPILVVGGPGIGDLAQEVFGVGAQDYLLEPFAPAQLRARVRTLILRTPDGVGQAA